MEKQGKAYLKEFHVENLWKQKNLHWTDIHEDVNILVGINGSGKTTLLNLIAAYCSGDTRELNRYSDIKLYCNPDVAQLHPISFLRSYDVTFSGDARKKDSPLMQELYRAVVQNKDGGSFFNYRMRMLDEPENAPDILKNINIFFDVVNSMLADTGKTISIPKGANNSTFAFNQGDNVIKLEQLSSGEKQLLLVLLKVFLLERKPAIILMDEPDISMHISWQQKLIEALRQLNDCCQIIMTTHSPSIFSKGWGDKVTFVEDIC